METVLYGLKSKNLTANKSNVDFIIVYFFKKFSNCGGGLHNKLLWEVPGIWDKLEEFENSKDLFFHEFKNLSWKTEKTVKLFAEQYLELKKGYVLENLIRDLNGFIYLLLLGKNYEQKFWNKQISQREREKLHLSFKRILKSTNFFLPKEDVPGNRMVNLVLIHLLVPKNSAEKFLKTALRLHKNLNGDIEKLSLLTKKELKGFIEKAPPQETIKNFFYACEYNETFSCFKEILKEAFFLIDEEVEVSKLPDWLENTFLNLRSSQESTKRPVKLMKNEKFIFLNWNKKRIRSTEDKENRKLYLAEAPVFLLVKNDFYEQLIEDENLDSWEIIEERENSKFLEIGSFVEDLEIDGIEIEIGDFEKLVNFEGKEINFLIPFGKGKVFSENFSAKIDPIVKEFKVETPDGKVFTLEDFKRSFPHFSTPGKYKISYRDKRKVSQIIYLLPKEPKVIKGLNVSYKGKIYKPGEQIEEAFGRFKISNDTIIEILKRRQRIFDENKKKIILPRLPEGFKAYLFNKCGEKLYVFSGNETLSLSNLPNYLLIYPLSLVFCYERERIDDPILIGKRTRKRCPLNIIIEELMSKKPIPLKDISEIDFPKDDNLNRKEREVILSFLSLSKRKEYSLEKAFIKYLYELVKNRKVVELFKVRRNIYLRRIANRHLRNLLKEVKK